jgi:hypothetical protein
LLRIGIISQRLLADSMLIRCDVGQVVTIDHFPDDVLLAIFDFYVFKDHDLDLRELSGRDTKRKMESWQSLVHVCRRWRSLVFVSPHRLKLQLFCVTGGYSRKSLDVWPALPLVIQGHVYDSSVNNVITKLKHSERIYQIDLHCHSTSQVQKLWTAIQMPFPKLAVLCLSLGDSTSKLWSYRGLSYEPVHPDSFLGGSVPHLRFLALTFIPFPGLPKVLLSATHLVKLWLLTVPHSGYISPEAMVTCLSMLTSLEELKLQFHSPQSSPDQESRPPVPPTRFVLPTLKTFSFKGVNEYLEELVARIDTPRLDRLLTSFFNDIDFNTPEFNQFINRTPTLGAYDEARLIFGSGGAQVRLCQFRPERSDHRMTEVNILCQVSDWQLSSLAQICTLSLQPFLTMENLYIHEDLDSPPNWTDDIENTEWLNLLLPFTAVKILYLSKPILPRIAPALQELAGARTTEVLPALKKVVFEGSQPWEPAQEGIVQFISARRFIENPVASSAWDRNLVPDVPPSARQYISASATSMGKLRFCLSSMFPVVEKHNLNSDRVRDLNSLLQHYRDGRGNLTRHFSWYLQQEGPAHQSVHHATAKCEPFDHSDD